MRKFFALSLVILQLVLNLSTADAQIKFSDCLLTASKKQAVSLGKPLANERLGGKSKLKIGVLPFNFLDSPSKNLTSDQKVDYLTAASKLEEISGNQIKIEFEFLPTVDSNISILDFKSKYLDQDKGWNDQNLPNSTWGFVKDLIAKNDLKIDYSKINSIVLEGNNLNKSITEAEAMDFFQSSNGNNFELSNSLFFRSVKTSEGFIDNAVLFDSHKMPNTIAHELLHNFGLTDLYGGSAGPALMSLMSAGAFRILNYERAVLGWFPIEKFTCTEWAKFYQSDRLKNEIFINDIKSDSIFMLKISDIEAYIFEVTQYEQKSVLLVYTLEQDLRPPIKLFSDPNLSYFSVFDIGDPKNIGLSYKTPDFNLIILNRSGNSAVLNMTPNNLVSTAEGQKLVQDSLLNRSLAFNLMEQEKKAKSDQEAMARDEATLKAKPQIISTKATITCLKGKTVKKVTAVNPKCPSGYIKK